MRAWEKEKNNLALLDEEFLAALQEQKEREIYARIASLDINELPIEYIEGKVTGGNISIDGSSSVRRTCSLTMVSDNVNINDVYWGLRTKFTLEIGLKNNLGKLYAAADGIYPEIVWFPQGQFVLTGFNTSLSTNNCNISISGKDKMCLLNGDLGGQLFASIDFGQEEVENKIFTPVKESFTSSNQLIGRSFYIKKSPADFPSGTLLSGSEISSDGHVYKFALRQGEHSAQDAHTFVRRGAFYQAVTASANFSEKEYDIYYQVEKPSDCFDPITSTPQSSETYYYLKDTNYYVIYNESTPGTNGPYYKIKDCYSLDYEYTIKKLPLEKIIRESVHAYAKEPYHNIIINDLDKFGLEQLMYKGDTDLYALRNYLTGHFTQMILSSQSNVLQGIVTRDDFYPDTLSDSIANTSCSCIQVIRDRNNMIYNQVSQSQIQEMTDAEKSNVYSVAIIKYGADIGYRVTDLTYTGDLVSGIGDSLTSVLDKIRDMLGDFEYFYDLTGRFVFQRKPTYVNTSFSQLTDNGDEKYVTYGNDKKKFSFSFEGNRLISAVQNAPALNNVKNDYSVWGKRTTISGAEVPIHVRYAIDKKPRAYHSLAGYYYVTQEEFDNSTVNDYEELAQQTREWKIAHFKQNVDIIPNFLKREEERGTDHCDWWELSDWAEWYKLRTGVYPSTHLMNYGDPVEGFTGTVEFPNEYVFSANYPLLIMDLNKNDSFNPLTTRITQEGTTVRWYPFQHGYYGCYHTYAEYLSYYAADPNMCSFIYKPRIPDISIIEEDQQNSTEPIENDETLIRIVDWREIIYQMALDYFAGQGCSADEPIYDKDGIAVLYDPDQFLSEVGNRNKTYYPTGITGYEQYYTDMEGFWRQLYNPDYVPQPIYTAGSYQMGQWVYDSNNRSYQRSNVWSDKALTGYTIQYYVSGTNPAVLEQINDLTQNNKQEILTEYQKYVYNNIETDDPTEKEKQAILKNRCYWNRDVFENPESLNFWIEFLDDDYELAQFSVPMIGARSKVVNEDKATAICFRDIPDLILSNALDDTTLNNLKIRLEIEENTGYTFILMPKGFSQYLTISYRSMSCKNKVDELLYKFAYCMENITITALPIYHLQPNTRIYVCDDTTKINGEYIVSKLSIPLAYNGMMSITATKAPERLY